MVTKTTIADKTKMTLMAWGLLIRDYTIVTALWLFIKGMENGTR